MPDFRTRLAEANRLTQLERENPGDEDWSKLAAVARTRLALSEQLEQDRERAEARLAERLGKGRR